MSLNLILHSMFDNVAANVTTNHALNQEQFAQENS